MRCLEIKKGHPAPCVPGGQNRPCSVKALRCLLLLYAEFSQFFHDGFAVICCFDCLVDVQDFSVLAHIVGPSVGHPPTVQAPKGASEFLLWIAQDWVIQVQTFCEVRVLLDIINACSEVRNIEIAQ